MHSTLWRGKALLRKITNGQQIILISPLLAEFMGNSNSHPSCCILSNWPIIFLVIESNLTIFFFSF